MARAAMEPSLIEESGLTVVEYPPEQGLMSSVKDADRVLEACFSSGADCALLHAANLTAGFFDLSSGEAGEILQKLRNYRIRLAVVCPPGSAAMSSRFGEMVAEERRGEYFGLFETRDVALEWLRRASEGAR